MTMETTAKIFLRNFLQARENEALVEVAPKDPEIIPGSEDVNASNVILSRPSHPRFYAGVKRNGAIVWAHDVKYARQVSAHLVELYKEKLGESLLTAHHNA